MTQTALTLSEAAEACGVSRSTIKRKLPEFGNAYQGSDGVWKVPIADLLGAGLKLRPRADVRPTQGHDPAVNGASLDQIQELTSELAAERAARQVAETKVMLLTANLEDLRFSLRAISGPRRAQEPDPDGMQVGIAHRDGDPAQELRRAAEPPVRRGWWARVRGY